LERRNLGGKVENYLGVFGHVNIDFLMNVERLPRPNTCIEVGGVKSFFGGTGANVALVAQSLGVQTALASFVGEDFPDDFRTALTKTGVDITDLNLMAGKQTPTCRIMTDPEGNQIGIMDQGPMADMDDYDVARHTVESGRIIHVGTGRPGYYERVMSLAGDLKKPVYFDPGQELHYVYDAERFKRLLPMAHALFVNRNELETALRYLGKKNATDLLEHVKLVIVTLGEQGSQILTDDGAVEISAIAPREVVDPTGAGDAYRAGFYAGMRRDLDLERCGLLGASAASFVIEAQGTLSRLPTWDDIVGRLER
jgi:sugar/nucleoside kinase (ribokinase family)